MDIADARIEALTARLEKLEQWTADEAASIRLDLAELRGLDLAPHPGRQARRGPQPDGLVRSRSRQLSSIVSSGNGSCRARDVSRNDCPERPRPVPGTVFYIPNYAVRPMALRAMTRCLAPFFTFRSTASDRSPFGPRPGAWHRILRFEPRFGPG
jgi:hypothetical protein